VLSRSLLTVRSLPILLEARPTLADPGRSDAKGSGGRSGRFPAG
jgi:hypothetical protein